MCADGPQSVPTSRLWDEACVIPDVLADLLTDPVGLAESAPLLAGARRIVATGNGAALYAAQALQLAAWQEPDARIDVVAVPAGMLASGSWEWRRGDVPLVFSSSGELRDVVALLPDRLPRPWVLSTATPGSTLHSAATSAVLIPVRSQRAVTHTQAFVGNVLAALMLWRAVTGRSPRAGLESLPATVAHSLSGATGWAEQVTAGLAPRIEAAVAFGTGAASVAALEAALLLKEVAGIPAEGLETREGATSGMYALRRGHLAVVLATDDDPLAEESALVCQRAGADVVRTPGGDIGPRTAAAITTFPAALALAATLGLRRGLDIDQPAWTSAYYATARLTSEDGHE